MGFDFRRCAEAALHAAFAEAFTPAPTRTVRRRRRRLRPVRNVFRLVRLVLMSIGLVTTARLARDPDARRAAIEALAQRFPVEGLLEELAVELEAARAAVAAQAEAETATAEAEGTAKQAATQHRRPASRTRGDTNGRRERKPPNRGTRAA